MHEHQATFYFPQPLSDVSGPVVFNWASSGGNVSVDQDIINIFVKDTFSCHLRACISTSKDKTYCAYFIVHKLHFNILFTSMLTITFLYKQSAKLGSRKQVPKFFNKSNLFGHLLVARPDCAL